MHATTGAHAAPPAACPVDAGLPPPPDEIARRQPLPNPVKALAGIEYAVKKAVLCSDLHSRAHAFYGQMRGQISAAKRESRSGDGRSRQ